MNINSAQISVFPATNRVGTYAASKLLSEKNLTNMISTVTDIDSYVISNTYSAAKFEFVVGGYYFETSGDITSISGATDIYGTLQFNTGSKTLLADAGTSYMGIEFTSTVPTASGAIYLHLLKDVDGVWTIPEESKLRIAPTSIDMSNFNVDGGTI